MQTIHLMGVGGSAMVALARLFSSSGYKVQGSDGKVYPPASEEIERLGLRFFEGYRAENLHPHPDLVVVGNVIPKKNPEAQELLRLGVEHISMPEALRRYFLKDKIGVMVTGTHGKTTSTSLMTWVFDCLGLDPGFFLGGIPKNYGVSSRKGEGRFFAVEGDEYDTAFFEKSPKFLHYGISNVILTSIEFDHADIYGSFEEIQAQFEGLVAKLPEDGILVANGDEKAVREVAFEKVGKSSIFYGEGPENNWRMLDFRYTELGTSYTIQGPSFECTVENSPQIGRYNALNHLATVAMTAELGKDPRSACEAIKSFQGVRRRQEKIADVDGVLFFEDFAHHPTAIRETLKAFRPLAEKRKGRLLAVLEPRSNTLRRKIFEKDLPKALLEADVVFLTPVYVKQDTLQKSDELNPSEVAEALPKGVALNAYDELYPLVKEEAREGDVVILMSNGDFKGELKKFKNLV